MNRLTIFLIIIILLSLSCSKGKKKFKHVELLRLGLPEFIDSSDFNKIGSTDYFSFDNNSDSVLMKTYDLVDPKTGIAEYPTIAIYHKQTVSQIEKQNLDSTIEYLRLIPNGQLPNNKKPQEWLGCDLFGTWIIIVIDNSDIKHYCKLPQN